jgi:chromosome segregation ATPase
MTNFVTSADLSRIRRLHVHEESYADKRMRERQEAKKAEKQERTTHAVAQQAQAQQAQAQQWQQWFRNSLQNELDGAEGLYAAIGENTADAKREVTNRLEPKIAELKQENEQLRAQLNELKAKVEMITSLAEMERQLDARQAGRDAAKKGEKGESGERGARGERGLRPARSCWQASIRHADDHGFQDRPQALSHP